MRLDAGRRGQLLQRSGLALKCLLLVDLVAELDALVADVDRRPGDELLDVLLALAAEGAAQLVGAPAATVVVSAGDSYAFSLSSRASSSRSAPRLSLLAPFPRGPF